MENKELSDEKWETLMDDMGLEAESLTSRIKYWEKQQEQQSKATKMQETMQPQITSKKSQKSSKNK